MSNTWNIDQYKAHIKEKSKPQCKIKPILDHLNISYQSEYVFHPTRKWRFDYAILTHKIAIEYEGIYSDKSRHTNQTGYTEDANKYNQAQILGWRVLRYTAKNIQFLKDDLKELIHK